MKTTYAKSYQSPVAIVVLLKNRGIKIDDEVTAESYLERIKKYMIHY